MGKKKSGSTPNPNASRKRPMIFLVILFLAWIPNHQACNVPVFRYALEQWPPDVYRVVVYYRGEMDPKAMDLLQASASDHDALANYSVTAVDVSTVQGKSVEDPGEWRELPWMKIDYPPNSSIPESAWEGPFHLTHVQRMLRSPGRSALAKGLLSGEASVWVLLKSGNEQKDKKALQCLKMNLKRASEELRIAESGLDSNGNPVDASPFKGYRVHFSLIEISRQDPNEAVLVNMLLGSESDLASAEEPMAFPVFGRGRVLYALVGDGIQEKTIFAACQSVINWCSCEIKALNPGIDLLISADWSNPSGGKMAKMEALPPLTGFADFMPEKAEKPEQGAKPEKKPVANPVRVEAIRHDSAAQGEIKRIHANSNVPLLHNLIVLAGMGITLVVIVSVILKSKRDKV